MTHDDQRLSNPAWLAENMQDDCPGGSFKHARVPGVTWVKDFPGQVTDGRIGRPTVVMVPLDWLPSKLQGEVRMARRALDAVAQ